MERNKIMSNIFRASLRFSVRNAVIMINSSENPNYITFYSYEVFSKKHCRNKIVIQEINRYENGSLQNDFLFPKHVSDFHGCLLNVSARQMPPILSFNGDVENETHLMESYRLSGVEGDILKVIAKELNFKIRLLFPKERNDINKNGISTGCFGDVSYY